MPVETQGMRNAANQQRQRELYGAPLGERVRRVTAGLRISQARLARALGMSPAMLSQLVSGRRVKIGDPAVLARLLVLDQRVEALGWPGSERAVEELLTEVAAVRWQAHRQGAEDSARRRTAWVAADALRRVAEQDRLVAAAATLTPAFPELADVLRQAAAGGPIQRP